MAAADLSSALPAKLRADAVILFDGPEDQPVRSAPPRPGQGRRLAVVVESQTAPDTAKRRVWPAYLTLARAHYNCPAVLVVICPDPATGRWARQAIATGHPGFDLAPLVIDSTSAPGPDTPGLAWAAPELAVLGAILGAIDVGDDAGRHLLLSTIAAAALDEDRLETYTHLILATASAAARNALETLMTTVFKDEFIDRIKAEGKAEGRAEGRADLILRILAARGFTVPARVRERVRSCDDLAQLETWGIRAVSATTLEEIFRD